jgi:hypothetical protein
MLARSAATFLALRMLATTLPAVGGYRCVAMGVRMQASSGCCDHERAEKTVAAPCCEAYFTPQLDALATAPQHGQGLQAPVASDWTFLVPATLDPEARVVRADARARGRPPGERLQRFGSVLRV